MGKADQKSKFIIVDGNDFLEADDINVTLGNAVVYTKKDQVGNAGYEVTNAVQTAGKKSFLSYVRVETTLATTALDLDIILYEDNPTTTSSDGVAWDASQSSLAFAQHVIEIREQHWVPDLGSSDSLAFVPQDELGQRIQAAANTTSVYFGVIWRGLDLTMGASDELKVRFGFDYIS